MTRSNNSGHKPVSQKRRNLLAILIAFSAVGLLYLNFDPTPAGGDFDAAVDVKKVSEEIALPTEAGASEANAAGPAGGTRNTLYGQTALLFNIMLLERGVKKLEKIADYTATFYKRERVNGTLGEGQVMKIKIRHKPFAVYMTWINGDKGRELLYVDGKYDGKMLVKIGGAAGRIVPTLKLDPTGDRAMAESRHPVTGMGMVNLAKTLLRYRRGDLKKKAMKYRMFDNQTINERNCYCFVIIYPNADTSKVYRKTIIFIDKEWSSPICVQNYGWPDQAGENDAAKLDQETIIEDYRYSSIRMDRKLADAHFDRYYDKYRLRR